MQITSPRNSDDGICKAPARRVRLLNDMVDMKKFLELLLIKLT